MKMNERWPRKPHTQRSQKWLTTVDTDLQQRVNYITDQQDWLWSYTEIVVNCDPPFYQGYIEGVSPAPRHFWHLLDVYLYIEWHPHTGHCYRPGSCPPHVPRPIWYCLRCGHLHLQASGNKVRHTPRHNNHIYIIIYYIYIILWYI